MLSPRAERYMAALERRPHVADLGAVRAALERVGVPVTDPLLDFHRAFAGYFGDGGDVAAYGLVHPEPVWAEPGEVRASPSLRTPELWFVACADAHDSYELDLDQNGVYYAGTPLSSSFFLEVERAAFRDEFRAVSGGRNYPLSLEHAVKELEDVLLPRLADRRVDDLSDPYCVVYATPDFVFTHRVEGRRFDVHVAAGREPPELAGFRYTFDSHKG